MLLLVGLGYRSVLPPAPQPASAPEAEFSAERAFEHLEVIARVPHPMGTPEIAEVRAYLINQLEELGIEFELQTTTAPDAFGGGAPVEVVNLVARIPGTASTGSIVLMGHYDTVPTTSGANDNSAAVSAVLETGRALVAGPPLRNDVVLLFTDAEEPAPRFGAPAFVADPANLDDIGLVVNFEANGGSGASVLVETSGQDRWLMGELAGADSHPAAFSFLPELARLLGDIGTDFDAFRNAGVTGLHFAYLRGSSIYHTAADDLEAVNRGALQHHGTHALGIARHFGGLDLSDPPPSGEAVFFTIQPFFVRYSTGWAIPSALVALTVFLVGAWRNLRGSGARMLGSVGRSLGAVVLGTVAGTLLWFGVVAMRPTLGVAESYLWFGAVMAVSAWAASKLAPSGRFRGAGIVAVWLLLAMLTALTLPGFSYLFGWPALAAAAALLWLRGDHAAGQALRFVLVATPALLLTIPAIDIFLQLAQPRPGNLDSQLPEAVAVSVLIGVLVVALLAALWPSSPPVSSHLREQESPGPA